MDFLTEELAQSLLAREWLVKADARDGSRLYFFKALVGEVWATVLITDLERVWTEVLSRPQAERRWSSRNPNSSASDVWRAALAAAHTTAGADEVSFEQVESTNSDLAIHLEYEGDDGWEWIWEAVDCGPRISARLLASQLIRPLLSMSHLALTSTGPPNALTDAELTSMIDKTARAARRMPETHARHAIGRGRPSSALARMASILGGLASPPSVVSDPDPPSLSLRQPVVSSFLPAAGPPLTVSPPPVASLSSGLQRVAHAPEPSPPRGGGSPAAPPPSQGGREPQPSPPPPPALARPRNKLVRRARPQLPAPSPAAASAVEPVTTAAPAGGRDGPSQTAPGLQPTAAGFVPPARDSPAREEGAGARASSGTESDGSHPPGVEAGPSSPPRKKPRESARESSDSSDDDSEAERRRHIARMKAGSAHRAVGGARQPIKRGAKRF